MPKHDSNISRSHRKETGKNKNASGSNTSGGEIKGGSESQRPRQLGQSSDKSNREET